MYGVVVLVEVAPRHKALLAGGAEVGGGTHAHPVGGELAVRSAGAIRWITFI